MAPMTDMKNTYKISLKNLQIRDISEVLSVNTMTKIEWIIGY
jgi:hypothetical protein